MAVQSSSALMIEALSELPIRWVRALILQSVLPNGLGCTVPNTFASFKLSRLGADVGARPGALVGGPPIYPSILLAPFMNLFARGTVKRHFNIRQRLKHYGLG